MSVSAGWQELPKLLNAEDVRAELLRFGASYDPKMTADEFLGGLGLRTEAAVGRALSTRLGLRSVTETTLVIEQQPLVAGLAFMCGMAAEGVHITSVCPTVDGDVLAITGDVPSSALHYDGTMAVSLTSAAPHVEARAQVVFPGQLCAFGAGRRLIRRVERTVAVAAERLRGCDSVSRPLL